MKGLLTKDLCLLLQRKMSIGILVIIAVVMGLSMNGVFVVGYVTMLAIILTLGSFAYDEMDNGYAFMMSLPVSRRDYVVSKYVLCFAGEAFGWGVAVVIMCVGSIFKNNVHFLSDILEAFAILPAFTIILAIAIPLHLKFGAEKSRLLFALFWGVLFLSVYAGGNTLVSALEISGFLNSTNDVLIMCILCIPAVISVCVSYLISKNIMEKKEF